MIRIGSRNVFQTPLGEIWRPYIVVEIANFQGEFISFKINSLVFLLIKLFFLKEKFGMKCF